MPVTMNVFMRLNFPWMNARLDTSVNAVSYSAGSIGAYQRLSDCPLIRSSTSMEGA